MFFYSDDSIRAVDAKFEAQKIAFAPLTFQAVKAMLDLGILQAISDNDGLAPLELAEKTGVSPYGISVLTEMALGMGVLKTHKDNPSKLVLGKIGWFLLEDEMTRVNFNFSADICYQGAQFMRESIQENRPGGLHIFGEQWNTIYEALSSLPEKARCSWFDFDHFYSDIAFPSALPLVFAGSPKKLLDIGGNTAKWAIACCNYNKDIQVTIVDLPGQTSVAEKNASAAGFASRIDFFAGNILDSSLRLPSGYDAVWMSQFLDCFSLEQITAILTKVAAAAGENTDVFVLEPLWDMQRFEASAYSLQATSLYFTCMANGCSKMYRFQELVDAIEKAGFALKTAHHNLGSNSYSLLHFKKLGEGKGHGKNTG
ncbi:MAG: class I SAM-dependent methyltransferase [Spirochaetaceae bacterium]|nr:class I SAM-dependent methyltransferase [Spirochaetaceae bacterium]MBR2362222.1 class I SAM-dependent methyltransferase [Spirochaetaceae bacterium]